MIETTRGALLRLASSVIGESPQRFSSERQNRSRAQAGGADCAAGCCTTPVIPWGACMCGRYRLSKRKQLIEEYCVLSANLRNQAGRCWRRVHASLSLARRRCKGASLRLTSSTEKASGSKSSPIHSRNSSYRLWSGSLRASSWFALEVRRNDLTLLR